jgi:hypothetical protein
MSEPIDRDEVLMPEQQAIWDRLRKAATPRCGAQSAHAINPSTCNLHAELREAIAARDRSIDALTARVGALVAEVERLRTIAAEWIVPRHHMQIGGGRTVYCRCHGCLASIDAPLIGGSAWAVDIYGWICPAHSKETP